MKADKSMLLRVTRAIANELSQVGHVDGLEWTVYDPEGDDTYINITVFSADGMSECDMRLSVAACK